MSSDQWTAVLIVAIPPTIAALASMLVSIINAFRIGQVHTIVNSRLSELVAANSRADRAEGVTAGSANNADIQRMIDEGIARAAAIPPTVSPEVLAGVVAGHTAVVAVALSDSAAEVATKLGEKSEKSP